MDTVVTQPEDELDSLLASQPVAVQDAAEDAEEYFRLMRTLVAMRRRGQVRQKDVAREMRTTQSAVSDLERLQTDPQVSTLFRYARAVGCRLRVVASVEDVVRASGAQGWASTVRVGPSPRISRSPHKTEPFTASQWHRIA